MQYLINAITSAAIFYGVVREEDRELYEYSFQIMLEQVSIGLSILIISLFYGVFFETVLYMVLFIPLRIYAGGFHARTFSWCYVISVGIYLVYVALLQYMTIPIEIISIAVFVSSVVILLLAPMEDPNKTMDMQEKTKFKKLVRIIIVIDLALFALSLWINCFTIICLTGFAFIHLACLLLAGFFRKKY